MNQRVRTHTATLDPASPSPPPQHAAIPPSHTPLSVNGRQDRQPAKAGEEDEVLQSGKDLNVKNKKKWRGQEQRNLSFLHRKGNTSLTASTVGVGKFGPSNVARPVSVRACSF